MRTTSGLVVALAVTLTACGSGEESPSADPVLADQVEGADHDDHDDHDEDASDDEGGREEYAEPRPRLAVIDRESPRIHVVDLVVGEIIDVVDLSLDTVVSEGVGTTEDGRYLLVGGTTAVDVVDVGSWLAPHGDHAHYYTTAPSVVGTIDGPAPTHLISNGGVTALYFDGSGEAVVIDDEALDDGEVAVVETLDTGAAHHGFAVPAGDGYVVTWPHGEEVLMPDHVAVMDDAHEVVSEHDCEQTHGEAIISGGVVAACQDGLLMLHAEDDGWHEHLIAYPEVDDSDPYGYGDARSWLVEVTDGVDRGLAALGTSHLIAFDFETGTVEAHDVGTAVAVRGVGIHGNTGNAVVLGHDGQLRLIDPDTGAVIAQAGLIDPFPVGDPAVPSRSVTVSGDLAWVVDPDADLVVEVDLADELSEVRRWELDFSPAAVTVHGDG